MSEKKSVVALWRVNEVYKSPSGTLIAITPEKYEGEKWPKPGEVLKVVNPWQDS